MTWWAYSLYALALAAAIGVNLRWHRNKVARERAISGRERAVNRKLQLADRRKDELIAELREKNDELDGFTYAVSHDLKSPLVTIRGFLGFVQQDAAAGRVERLGQDIERIDQAAAAMDRLLDDLLQHSRVGRQFNPPEEVAMSDLAATAASLLAGEIVECGVDLEIQPGMPTVVGDRIRLLQVMQNLLHNAVKFIGDAADPQIEVGVRAATGRGEAGEIPVFFVRDNGIGIEAVDQERVFALFTQIDRRLAGTGIGLALVKRIVEIHGGWIRGEAPGEGRGSTFFFTIPTAPEPA